MEVRNQPIHHPEPVTGGDVEASSDASGHDSTVWFGPAFQSPDDGGPHSDQIAAPLVDCIGCFGRDRQVLGVNLMVFDIDCRDGPKRIEAASVLTLT